MSKSSAKSVFLVLLGDIILSQLNTLEGACIKQWVNTKKYKVISSYGSYCIHCKMMNRLISRENDFNYHRTEEHTHG